MIVRNPHDRHQCWKTSDRNLALGTGILYYGIQRIQTRLIIKAGETRTPKDTLSILVNRRFLRQTPSNGAAVARLKNIMVPRRITNGVGKDGDYVAEFLKAERRMFVGNLLNIVVQRSDYSIIL